MRTTEAINQFMLSRKAKGLAKDTLRWYAGILNAFQKVYQKLPDKPELIEKFLAIQTAGDERRHGYYRALKAFYNYLERRHRNPIKSVEPPQRRDKLPKPLWPDELNRIFSQKLDTRVRGAMRFFLDSGARLGEFTTLGIDHLHEVDGGYFALIRGKTGERLVPISYETYHDMMISLPLKWSKDWLGRLISNAFRGAGLRGGAHRLRHTFGTFWEGDEIMLQRIMGHSSLATTRKYRWLRINLMLKQHKQYTPLNLITNQKDML